MLNDMGKQYVIGDIHGCIRTFRSLAEEKIRLNAGDSLYLLGDYIDRGPDSKAVIDYILDLRKNKIDVIPLMGNHEFMLLASMKDREFFRLWMLNAGFTTLRDFGIEEEQRGPEATFLIPRPYRDFFRELFHFQEAKGYFLTHACFEGRTENPLDDTDSMIWRRTESYNRDFLKGRVLIHGHTPASLEDIRRRVEDPQSVIFNLDGGCVYSANPRLGHLVGMELNTRKLFWERNRE